jgi:hypothetical protein
MEGVSLLAPGVVVRVPEEGFSFWQPSARAAPETIGTATHHLVLFVMGTSILSNANK